MTWSSKTLADQFPAVVSNAQAALAATQKEIDAINAAIERLQQLAGEAQARSDAADNLINDLSGDAESSGIFNLVLAPGTGLWNERILYATGAPPLDPNAYTAIVVSLSLVADPSAATKAKESIEKAVSVSLPPAPPMIKVPAIKPPPKPVLPVLPEPEPLPENEWKSATVADLFPGTQKTIMESVERIKKEAAKTLYGITQLQEKRDELQQALDDTQDLVDSLVGTGVYAFTADPELVPSGSWYDRLIASSPDRPPLNPLLYSSGTVTVVQATSYPQLLARYGKLQSILNTSLT